MQNELTQFCVVKRLQISQSSVGMRGDFHVTNWNTTQRNLKEKKYV